MNVDDLLNRLEGVRKTHADHWIAKCPAHKDKSPSLSINVGAGGRILLYDFGGCSVHVVLAAVGLTVGDLFEQRMRPRTREERRLAQEAFRRHGWEAALRVIDRASLRVQVAAGMLLDGDSFTAADRAALQDACRLIEDARYMLAPGGDAERDLRRLRK